MPYGFPPFEFLFLFNSSLSFPESPSSSLSSAPLRFLAPCSFLTFAVIFFHPHRSFAQFWNLGVARSLPPTSFNSGDDRGNDLLFSPFSFPILNLPRVRPSVDVHTRPFSSLFSPFFLPFFHIWRR